MMVERFAGYHRQSYGGCIKVGVGDDPHGPLLWRPDTTPGCAKASHKDKIIEMQHLNETLFGCGIACSATGKPTKSGNYLIDLLLASVCASRNVTSSPMKLSTTAGNIAGGTVYDGTVGNRPAGSKKIGPYVDKYLKGVSSVSTENRLKVLRLVKTSARARRPSVTGQNPCTVPAARRHSAS